MDDDNENDGMPDGDDRTRRTSSVDKAARNAAVPSEQEATETSLNMKEKMSSFERATIRWTRANFGVVVFTMFFIGLQWWEMRSGGADTHTLAVAMGKQATWTERLKGSADTQAGWMKDLAGHMKDEATQTGNLARFQEEANEPSVNVSSVGVWHFDIDPLVQNPKAGTPVMLVRVYFQNNGTTEAQQIFAAVRSSFKKPSPAERRFSRSEVLRIDPSSMLPYVSPNHPTVAADYVKILDYEKRFPNFVNSPLYVWGVIEFANVAGKKQKPVEFCRFTSGNILSIPGGRRSDGVWNEGVFAANYDCREQH